MPSPASAARRRTAILNVLAAKPRTLAALRTALQTKANIEVSPRQLEKDVAELRRRFPGRLVEADCEGRATVWRFQGEPPRVLEPPIAALDEDQITALIAARGLLRLPDPEHPSAEGDNDAYHGTLAQAVDRLLRSAGLEAEARAIAPDAVAISRFGVAVEEPAAFPVALAAIQVGEALRFTYRNLAGATHPVHAQPVRLVHIAGEWHLFAWAPDARRPPGCIKQYRLSRLHEPRRVAASPPGCPVNGLRGQVSALLCNAFRATGSQRPEARRIIDLLASPQAWPFLEGRRWGADQNDEGKPPPDTPPGWRRLRFSTTGLDECRHWLLSFGAEIRVLAPDAVRVWLATQAQALVATYVQTNSAAARTGRRPRVSG